MVASSSSPGWGPSCAWTPSARSAGPRATASPAAAERLAGGVATGAPLAVLKTPEVARFVGPRGAGVLVPSRDGALFLATRAGLQLVCALGGALAGTPAVLGDRAWLPRSDGL